MSIFVRQTQSEEWGHISHSMSDVRMDLGAPFYPAMLGWAGQSHGRVSLIGTEQVHNVNTNIQKLYQSRQEGSKYPQVCSEYASQWKMEKWWSGRPALLTTTWCSEWAVAGVLSCHPTLGQPGHQSGAPTLVWSGDKWRPARQTKHLPPTPCTQFRIWWNCGICKDWKHLFTK